MAEVARPGKTLVLCFDGTSSQYDTHNTNVPQLFALLKKNDYQEQLCYYQPGIGTWFNPGVVSPLFTWGAKVLDNAFAWYLDTHVIEGYKFIMNNWRQGDKICLFGFSRGAYTARALAGALHKIGLLPRENDEQVPFAYQLYKREDEEGLQLCEGFKKTYCQDVKIEFIGVWDTVASVGLIMGRTLPFVSENGSIKTFRHALSLDEHRARFQPNQYHVNVNPSVARTEGHREPYREAAKPDTDSESDPSSSGVVFPDGHRPPERKPKMNKLLLPFRRQNRNAKVRIRGSPDDVLEVWFVGGHSDIGGGAVPNATPNALSNITLRWMVREIVKSQCGIQFDSQALAEADIDLTLDDSTSRPLDEKDVLEPIDDELKNNPLWWILEILPMNFTWQDVSGKWVSKFGWHLGRGRYIVNPAPVFHSSVKTRMVSLKYKPRAQWTQGKEVYVS